MEHALLNDESELGQELVGWHEGCPRGAWKARVELRAITLRGQTRLTPTRKRGRNVCVRPSLCWFQHASSPVLQGS